MQTFLPYSDYKKSAKCLDMKRLGKQRVECLQLIMAIIRGPKMFDINGNLKNTPWYNHPACKMWQNNLGSLLEYAYAICDEWILRGYKDTVKDKLIEIEKSIPNLNKNKPNFIYDKRFLDSHKSNLLRKKPDYYNSFNWNVPNDLEYVWPEMRYV